MRLTLPLAIGTSMIYLVFGLLYFGLLVHPYRFIIFIFFEIVFPSFSIILLIFAYQKPEKSSSDGNVASEQVHGNNRSSKDQPPTTTHNSELVSSTVMVAPIA